MLVFANSISNTFPFCYIVSNTVAIIKPMNFLLGLFPFFTVVIDCQTLGKEKSFTSIHRLKLTLIFLEIA